MSTRTTSQKLIGNPVTGSTTGEMIAKIEDLQIDPNTLSAVAAITSKATLLRREVEAIEAAQVEVWGQDAILVKKPDVVVKEVELSGRDGWLSASDDIRSYEVVVEDGTRVGTLSNLVLATEGPIVGYEMADLAI